jgi:hypothetical protein
MKNIIPFFIGLFVGCLITWISTKDSPSEYSQAPVGEVKISRRTQANHSSNLTRDTTSQSTKETYTRLVDSYGKESDKIFEAQSQKELQQLITHLFAKAAPLDGVQSKDRTLLNKTILKLAANDLTATCHWLDNEFSPAPRSHFYKHIIKEQFQDLCTQLKQLGHSDQDISNLKQAQAQGKSK